MVDANKEKKDVYYPLLIFPRPSWGGRGFVREDFSRGLEICI